MNEAEARERFLAVLDALGVSRGDVLYLGINIGHVPLPAYKLTLTREAVRERERMLCHFVYSTLMSAIGNEGTLLVPTFTYAYASGTTPYIHETSPSETGPFTEFVRTLPDSHRSLHPIHSIAGLGAKAGDILENVGKAAYGPKSAFGRLTEHDAKFLCLGVSIGDTLTYVHHLEQVYGANHRYNKIFDGPVSRAGQPVAGPWLCFLRYLGVAAKPRIAKIEAALRAQNCLKECAYNEFPNQIVRSRDVDRVGLSMLAEDPCAFVSDPVRVYLDETAAAANPSSGPSTRFSLSLISD